MLGRDLCLIDRHRGAWLKHERHRHAHAVHCYLDRERNRLALGVVELVRHGGSLGRFSSLWNSETRGIGASDGKGSHAPLRFDPAA